MRINLHQVEDVELQTSSRCNVFLLYPKDLFLSFLPIFAILTQFSIEDSPAQHRTQLQRYQPFEATSQAETPLLKNKGDLSKKFPVGSILKEKDDISTFHRIVSEFSPKKTTSREMQLKHDDNLNLKSRMFLGDRKARGSTLVTDQGRLNNLHSLSWAVANEICHNQYIIIIEFLKAGQSQVRILISRKLMDGEKQQYLTIPSLQEDSKYPKLAFQECQRLFQTRKVQYLEQIKKDIESLRSSNQDKKNQSVIDLFYSIFGAGKLYKCEELNKIASSRITQLIKEKVATTKAQFSEEQRDFYIRTAQFNRTLTKLSYENDKKWLLLFEDEDTLFRINLSAFFFRENKEYKKQSYIQKALWNCQEISQILQIPTIYLRHVSKVYQYFNELFEVKFHKSFIQRLAVFSLIKFRIKMLGLKKKFFLQWSNNSLMYRKKEEISKNVFNTLVSEVNRYHLCEIAIFAKQKEIKLLPNIQKKFILDHLERIIRFQSITDKKRLVLSLKMQYFVSFKVIDKMIFNIRKNNPEQNKKFFEQEVFNDLDHLWKKIQYVYVSQLSTLKALSKLELMKNYKVQLTHHFNVSREKRSDVIACFTKATLAKFKRYYQMTALQLQLQELLSPILAINRFQFSFNDLVGIDNRPSVQDLVSTLFIATQGKKIIFFSLVRQKIKISDCLQELTRIIKQKNVVFPPATVLFENQMTNPLRWIQLNPFIDYIYSQHHSRLYISSRSTKCLLNSTIFIYIQEYLRSFKKLLSTATFFPLVEFYTQKIITIYNLSTK